MGALGFLRDKAKSSPRVVEAYRTLVAARQRARTGRRIQAFIQSPGPKRLMLGAGSKQISGWLASDIRPLLPDTVFLDATKPFPLPDACLHAVFSEHMIEHLGWEDGRRMLGECFRTLKPDGILRISTPDLGMIVGLYDREDQEAATYVDWVMGEFLPMQPRRSPHFVINNAFRAWGHQFLYDRTLLREGLEEVGFSSVTEVALGESEHPELRNMESHGDAVGNPDMVAFETFVLEARKGG